MRLQFGPLLALIANTLFLSFAPQDFFFRYTEHPADGVVHPFRVRVAGYVWGWQWFHCASRTILSPDNHPEQRQLVLDCHPTGPILSYFVKYIIAKLMAADPEHAHHLLEQLGSGQFAAV